MALQLTNRQILKLCKDEPTFDKFSSKITKKVFTEEGFEELKDNDKNILADFFGLSVRVYLQKIRNQDPHIPKIYSKIVEEYPNAYGGIAQRINVYMPKPVNPQYKKLVNGGSIDPFKIRLPKQDERFYKQNFDYSNFRTIQDIELKKMFINKYGIAEFIAKLRAGFDDAYYVQKYETMRKLLSLALNSEKFPLKESQIIELPEIKEDSTNNEMALFIQKINNLGDLMDMTVMSGMFNAKTFEHGMYKNEYKLLIRADIFNKIKTTLLATTYHTQNLNFDFEVIKVKDFGGITYEDKNGKPLVEIYDEFGACIGYGLTEDSEPLPVEDLVPIDPNEDVQAVLIQKGALFTSEQLPYSIKSIYNPAGEYLNIYANQPNSAFNYDATYDIIKFVKPTTQAQPTEPTEPTEP